jgi:hypothetical protein
VKQQELHLRPMQLVASAGATSSQHTTHLPEAALEVADMRLVLGDSLAGEPARLAGPLRGWPHGRSELPLMEPRLTDDRLTDVRLVDGRWAPSRGCGPAEADLQTHSGRTQHEYSVPLSKQPSRGGCRITTHGLPALI